MATKKKHTRIPGGFESVIKSVVKKKWTEFWSNIFPGLLRDKFLRVSFQGGSKRFLLQFLKPAFRICALLNKPPQITEQALGYWDQILDLWEGGRLSGH